MLVSCHVFMVNTISLPSTSSVKLPLRHDADSTSVNRVDSRSHKEKTRFGQP